jgi:hypothetical protein
MARYNGRRGLVYLATTGAAAATAVARLNAWTLDMSRNFSDATAFEDLNQQYTGGKPNFQGTLSGIWDDTDDHMYDAMMGDGLKMMYLYPSALVLTKYFYNYVEVDFSMEVGVADTIGFSANFAAAGDHGQM